MAEAADDKRWVAEAIVEFLRSPSYTHPLMAYIDEHCLIFTPDEENKLEYTAIHQGFQARVDQLLTGFLDELGVSAQEFHDIAANAMASDQLTSFVVHTILTVDDFLMFKAMMVKRNSDLANQVLQAVDELREATMEAPGVVAVAGLQSPTAAAPVHVLAAPADTEDVLQQVIEESKADFERQQQTSRLQQMMRSLQMQDEDVALAIAMAESLKDLARQQSELAEREQAAALARALEAEQARSAAALAASKIADGISSLGGVNPAAGTATAAPPAVVSAAPLAASTVATPGLAQPTVAPATPPAVAAEPLPAAPQASLGTRNSLPKLTGLAGSAAATSRPADLAGGDLDAQQQRSSRKNLSTVLSTELPPLRTAPSGSLLPAIVTAARANASTMDSARRLESNLEDTGSDAEFDDPAIEPTGSSVFGQGGVRARALGFRSQNNTSGGGLDKESVREAAAAAAATQKSLIAAHKTGKDQGDDSALAWLQDAKKHLVAQNQEARDAEMKAYRASKAAGSLKPPAGEAAAPAANDVEAKRAALSDRLAAKFRQGLSMLSPS